MAHTPEHITPGVNPFAQPPGVNPVVSEQEGNPFLRKRQTPPGVNPFLPENKPAPPLERAEREFPLRSGKPVKQTYIEKFKDLFTGESRTEYEDLPEITAYDYPEIDWLDLRKGTLGMLTASTPQQQMDVIAEALPGAEFTQDKYGNYITEWNGTVGYINKPGLTMQDTSRFVADIIAFAPAAKYTQAGKGLLPKMMRAFSSSTGTAVGLDTAAGLAGGKGVGESIEDVSLLQSGAAGVVGAATEVVTNRFGALKNIIRNRKIGPELDKAAAQTIKEASEKSGIDLYTPQVTGDKSTMVELQTLQSLPAASKIIAGKLKKQNTEAYDATLDLLEDVSGANNLRTAPQEIRDSAKQALETMRTERTSLVNQQYTQAIAENPPIDRKNLLDSINTIMGRYSPESGTYEKLRGAKNMLEASENFQQYHTSKEILDDMINKIDTYSSADKSLRRGLTEIKSVLVKSMDDASPLYSEAKELYKNASVPINKLENSMLGQLENINENQLERVRRIIFDPNAVQREEMQSVKKIIRKQNPEAWNKIVRYEMQDRINRALKISEADLADETINMPFRIRESLFGSKGGKRDALFNAMNPGQRKKAEWLDLALQYAAKGRVQGSTTFGQGKADERMKAALSTFLSPQMSMIRYADQASAEKYARNMVDLLMGQKWDGEIKKIMKNRPRTKKAILALATALERVGVEKSVNGFDITPGTIIHPGRKKQDLSLLPFTESVFQQTREEKE